MQLRDLAGGTRRARPSGDGGHPAERAVGARLRGGPGTPRAGAHAREPRSALGVDPGPADPGPARGGRALPEGPRPLARPPRRARHHDPGDDPEPRGELPGGPLDPSRLHHPPGLRDRGGVRVDQAGAGELRGVGDQDRRDLLRHRSGALPSRRGRPAHPGRARARPRPRPSSPRWASARGAATTTCWRRWPASATPPPHARLLFVARRRRASRPCAIVPSGAASATRCRCSGHREDIPRSSPPATWWWTPPTPGSG